MVTHSSLLVIFLYILITLLISYFVNKRYNIGGNFSTGGRQFNWFTAGVSILATYVSAMTFVGMPGWVYKSGMEVMSIHLNYPIVIFFAVIFFVPVFYKLKLVSIYEYLEYRFGVYARSINSIVFILVQSISAGVILYTVALVLVQVIPISISQSIIYISIFTALYTYAGGITTVIWTDLLQSAVLMIGVIAIFITLIMNIDTFNGLQIESLNLINTEFNLSNDTNVWSGLVAVTFLHLSVYATNQLIIQRTLATKCVKTAQKSMLFCGYGAFFIYLLFSVLGVLLNVFYQGKTFENSNQIILDFVFNHTHPIIIGLIISSLAAAAMSTLDSTYNSIATVATFDIYKRFARNNASEQHYEIIARRLSLLAAIMVVGPALLSISNESVLKTIASLASVFVGIRLGSFVLGLFSSKANEKGVIVGSIASIFSVLMAMYQNIAWPWFAPIGTITFLLVSLFISQFWGSLTSEQQHFITQQKKLFAKPTTSHYSLLIFAIVTILVSMLLPNWLGFILTKG